MTAAEFAVVDKLIRASWARDEKLVAALLYKLAAMKLAAATKTEAALS